MVEINILEITQTFSHHAKKKYLNLWNHFRYYWGIGIGAFWVSNFCNRNNLYNIEFPNEMSSRLSLLYWWFKMYCDAFHYLK
jgi:hypothetical protein